MDKALEYRRTYPQDEIELTMKDPNNKKRKVFLYDLAEQTNDRTELRNKIMQAAMVAQETIAVLASNFFFLLSRHPAVWQRLREEVMSFGDSQIDLDLLQGMGYLRHILNESMAIQRNKFRKRLI